MAATQHTHRVTTPDPYLPGKGLWLLLSFGGLKRRYSYPLTRSLAWEALLGHQRWRRRQRRSGSSSSRDPWVSCRSRSAKRRAAQASPSPLRPPAAQGKMTVASK